MMLALLLPAGALAQDPLPAIPDSLPVTKEPPAHDGSVRICSGGDVTLGNNLDAAWAARAARQLRTRWGRSADPDSLMAPIRALVADADIVLLNVESAIGQGPAPRKCGPGSTSCFAFRAPPEAATAFGGISARGRVVGNIANNHARDAGPSGFLATRRLLEQAGVHVTGADTIATPVPTPWGDTIAFLGFYTSAESPDVRDLAAVRRHVARAKRRWPLVVVTAHMGAEGNAAQRTPNRTEIFLGRIDRGNPVAFAHTAFDAGASLVIGHGPHVMRAAEWHGERLAFYSLGNLLTYGPFNNREPSSRGAIACATLTRDGRVREASVRSTRQLAPGVLTPDPAHRAAALMDSLGRLDFPQTGARIAQGGEVVVPWRDASDVNPDPDSTRVPDARPLTPPERSGAAERRGSAVRRDSLGRARRDSLPLPPRRDTLPRDTLPRDTLPRDTLPR